MPTRHEPAALELALPPPFLLSSLTRTMKTSLLLLNCAFAAFTLLQAGESNPEPPSAFTPEQMAKMEDWSLGPYRRLGRTVLVAEDEMATRLDRVFAKAARGEKVVVGVIGGSITQGAKATKPEHRYANVIAQWWRDRYPQAEVLLVNAGI